MHTRNVYVPTLNNFLRLSKSSHAAPDFRDLVRPAPRVLRPYDGLAHPGYPLGCSRLCNHPMDTRQVGRDYRDDIRRARSIARVTREYKVVLLR